MTSTECSIPSLRNAIIEESLDIILREKGYQIDKFVIGGRFGKIFKGQILATKQPIAIKFLDLTKFPINYKVKYLPRELAALMCIRHEFIIHNHGIIKFEQNVFIFMDWANGDDLTEHLIRSGSCSESLAGHWLFEITSALHYLHIEMNVTHRDLKLDNILLHNHSCRLTDFGFSKCCRENLEPSSNYTTSSNFSSVLTRTYCGSEPYLSPQLAARGLYDPFKNDVWALGVIIYCLLNNKFPFKIGNIKEMIEQQKDSNFLQHRFTCRMTKEVRSLMTKLLDPDEDKRLPITKVVSDDWIKKHSHK